jgi:hypothetical protein
MGATLLDDQIRLVLEDAIGIIKDIDDEQEQAMMLLSTVAVTATHGDVLKRMATVRKRLRDAHQVLVGEHPNRR